MAENTESQPAAATAVDALVGFSRKDLAQTERIGLGDLIISGIIAGVTWLMLWLWEYPAISPVHWKSVAVASSMRPAAQVISGYWQLFGSLVYGVFGVGPGERLMILFGHFFMALVAVGVFMIFREGLAFIMRARPQRSRRRTTVMRIAAMIGALAFVFSEPVWAVGQCFSETTVLILLSVGALEFFFAFLRKGSLRYSYVCAICLGLLAAESVIGLVLLAAFIFINSFVLKRMPVMESPFFNPALIAVGKWYMTFFFLGALFSGIVFNCGVFIVKGGMSATGIGIGGIPLAYLTGYVASVTGALDMLGWILFVTICFFPFMVTVLRFPTAADEEFFLKYATGMVFLICGVMSLSQSGPIPALWFWTYCKSASPFLICVGTLMTSATLAGGLTILGVDALCRDHRRLARQIYGIDVGEVGSAGSKATTSMRRVQILRYLSIFAIPGFILLVMLPGRFQRGTREMLEIVRDAVTEIVDEAGRAKFIFTDGNLDPALEVEGARRGNSLVCLSLASKSTPYDVYLRTRSMAGDGEDLYAFRFDTGMGLRTWMRDKPERLSNSVVQVGFDLWKRDGKALPPVGGMLSHPLGWRSEQSRLKSIERAKALAERILSLHHRGEYDHCTDRALKEAFSAVQWRLARMCIYRADTLDLAGDAGSAMAETKLAKRLNDCNEYYQKILSAHERHNESLMRRLTPREGLQLALVRADFTMGKTYAEVILESLPENADANFALGMFYVHERQYNRAEEYLKRCLISKPEEPSIYNNIAMIQLELGKLDAALINVNKALNLLPDSAEVQDTKRQIQQAMRKRR